VIDPARIKEWISDRRWFGDKDASIERVDLVDHVQVGDDDPALVLAIVRVLLEGSRSQLYFVPVLAHRDGGLQDALESPDSFRVLGEPMAHGTSLQATHGAFHFNGPGLDPSAPLGTSSVRVVGTEQSNSSVVLDESVILKIYRRIAPGPNPDVELTRILTSEGFENVPPHVGDLSYTSEASTGHPEPLDLDLGLAQTFLGDGVDGWEMVLAGLTAAGEGFSSSLLDKIENLGEIVSSLHVLLSREEIDPDLAPEPVDHSDLKMWVESTRESLSGLVARGVEGLEAARPAIDRRVDAAEALSDAGQKIRIHGDLHLGQAMYAGRGWMVLDFEGEPARTLQERRAKHSALKDVAGMLRSLSYAVASAQRSGEAPGSLEEWEVQARDRFLTGYLRQSHEGHFLPADRAALDTLLELFEIDKALYEIRYELNNRPDWLEIPLAGLDRILRREVQS
jgi:maltokinase